MVDDMYIKGGFHTCSSIAARDAITKERRKAGMRVTVVGGSDYYLGTDLITWEEIPATGSGGTTDHTALSNRDLADQHIIGSVTGLQTALDSKANQSTTYTKTETDNAISTVVTSLDWKESVATFADIATAYPTPSDGWTVSIMDTDITYRYDGAAWVAISANSIPMASALVDGKMSSTDYTKLNNITGTNTGDETSETIKTKLGTDLTNKVDKVEGKSLILDTEITRLGTLANYNDATVVAHMANTTVHVTSAEKTVWNNKSIFDGAYASLTGQPTIPSKTSELTNDSNFLTTVPSEYVNETELTTALSSYALATAVPDVTNKLEVANLIQGTNVTLLKDGNNVTINATGGGSSTVYTGATDLLDGEVGLVVKPLIADKDKYLKGDGTWSVITGTGTSDYNSLNNKPTAFIGATSETNGAQGFVPTPTITDINKYLSSNGDWESITVPVVDTVLNLTSTNAISNSAVTTAFNALTSGVQDYIGYFADLTARNAYVGTLYNGDWCTVAVDSNYANATTNYIYNSTIPAWVYNGTVSTTQIVIDDSAVLGDNDVAYSADKVLTLLAAKPDMSNIVEVSTSTSWILSDDGNYYYQSIAVNGITADKTKTKVDVSISDTHTKVQYLTACNAILNPISQTENAFTLACYGTRPTITIPLTIVVEQVVGA